nr:S41 family peptidase [Spirochaetaceae bacterium]
LFKEVNLWSDEVDYPESLDTYENVYDLLDDLRVPQDPYSFIASEENYTMAFDRGNEWGFGFRFSFNSAKELRITETLTLPKKMKVQEETLPRGTQILSINGVEPWQFFMEGERESNSLVPKDTWLFQFKLQDGSIIEKELVFRIFHLEAIHDKQIFHLENGDSAGYFAFSQFYPFIRNDFYNLFSDFAALGINQLIIDLRENSGGKENIAIYMINQLVGEGNWGEPMINYNFNDRYCHWNRTWDFNETALLDVDRVIFLTSKDTLSASEMLINCLKPYVETLVIGGSTGGKSYDMHDFSYENYIFFPIVSQNSNADGETVPPQGITPDVLLYDQIEYPFGDIDDPLIQEALYYLNTGTFHDLSRDDAPYSVGEPRISLYD